MRDRQDEEHGLTQSDTMQLCPSCGLAVGPTVTVCPQDGTQLNDPFADAAFEHRYKFLATVASGGMGVVYKAQQLGLDKIVAIKMIHAHLLAPHVMQRFHREAKAMAMLSHPNILNVIEFGATKSGQPFIVMDYLKGSTLAQVLEAEQMLDTTRFLKLFLQTCNGLMHAHTNGVLHRDIKPSNIMICKTSEGETVKILDFGIAKMTDEGKASPMTLTKTGETVGSPQYMSPEQSKGEEVDQRSDLYSLGCVMYESLAGTPPFAGKALLETMLMHLNEKPRSLFEVSGKKFDPKIEEMIAKLLAKAPAERYQTAGELRNDLLAISPTRQSGFGGFTVPTSLPRASKVSPKALMIGLGTIAVVAICVGASRVWYANAHPPAQLALEAALNSDAIHLDVSQKKLGLRLTDNDLEQIKDNHSIQTIDLSNAAVTDAAFKTLSKLQLTGINLSGTKVVTLDGIQSIETLRSLDVGQTSINASALPNIKVLYGLQELSLRDTTVPANTLEQFDKLDFIRKLDIEGCSAISTNSIDNYKMHHPECIVQYTNPLQLRGQAMDSAAAKDWPTACELIDRAKTLALASHNIDQYCDFARDKCEILSNAHEFPRTADACEAEIKTIEAAGGHKNVGQIYNLRGMALESCNRNTEAIQAYGKALDYDLKYKDFSNYTLIPLFHAVHNAVALNDSKAIARFMEIAADPRWPQTPFLGHTYVEIGQWLVTQGANQKALDYLLKAKKIYDHSPSYVTSDNFGSEYAWLGRAYKNLGDSTRSAAFSQRALEISDNAANRVLAYTDLLDIAKRKNNTKAIADLTEKLKEARFRADQNPN